MILKTLLSDTPVFPPAEAMPDQQLISLRETLTERRVAAHAFWFSRALSFQENPHDGKENGKDEHEEMDEHRLVHVIVPDIAAKEESKEFSKRNADGRPFQSIRSSLTGHRVSP